MNPGADSSPHILVCDDNREIRELLSRYLQGHGLRTSLAESAAAARRILAANAIDLVVLDVMMPGEDGLSLCRDLAARGEVPVILLTAMAEETDRIVGLEVGADDYLTKPFNPRELLARIKAVLRRSLAMPRSRERPSGERLAFDRWILHVGRHELESRDGAIVPLSTGEFALLAAFLARPRLVLSRDQLLDLTRGREAGPFDRAIDNQVSRLRRKIEADAKNPQLIRTHWGGGYSFEAEVEAR